jgi:hypothetical protein
LKTNISLADLWLQGMAIGAAAHNLTIQYCMPYPNQILAAATLSSTVTNARATGDYMPNTAQWAIGATSLFFWALGILPFKDGFYSSTLPQIGGQTKGPELRPDLQALMATLSCAMVGPMDGINLMNATRIKATCRSDGKILKPDSPVRTSDGCFYRPTVPHSDAKPHDPSSCYIYLTHSDVPGLGRLRYLFGNETNKAITPAMAHIERGAVNGSAFAIYNWYTRELGLFEDQNTVAPGYEDFSYSMITPILPGGWIFLGEVDKYVPVSRLRFSKVSALDGYHLQVEASGVPGEQIRICTAKVVDLTRIHCDNIVFQSSTLHRVIFESLASTSISARIIL